MGILAQLNGRAGLFGAGMLARGRVDTWAGWALGWGRVGERVSA